MPLEIQTFLKSKTATKRRNVNQKTGHLLLKEKAGFIKGKGMYSLVMVCKLNDHETVEYCFLVLPGLLRLFSYSWMSLSVTEVKA